MRSAQTLPPVGYVTPASDVIYPAGAMKDYEAKFWLPFKGITRPVYAIPGNHDWYDALEAFAGLRMSGDRARALRLLLSGRAAGLQRHALQRLDVRDLPPVRSIHERRAGRIGADNA